jgi:hypothetical protein
VISIIVVSLAPNNDKRHSIRIVAVGGCGITSASICAALLSFWRRIHDDKAAQIWFLGKISGSLIADHAARPGRVTFRPPRVSVALAISASGDL